MMVDDEIEEVFVLSGLFIFLVDDETDEVLVVV